MAGNPLEVTLSAKLDQYERDMARAGDLAGDAVSKIEQTFANANPKLGGLSGLGIAGGLATALGIGGLIEAAVKANSVLADMLRNARELGLTLERFQSVQFAGAISGLDPEKINDGLRKMVGLVSDAQEHENSLSKLYEANGLKIKDSNGALIDTNTILQNAFNLISRATSMPDKLDFLRMLGLTREWLPLLEKGSAAFEKTATEARAAGVIIEDDIVRKAAKFDEEWRKASVTFEANMKAALVGVLPFLNALVEGAVKVAEIVGRFHGLLADLAKESIVGFEGLNVGELERRLERFKNIKENAEKLGTDPNTQSILGISIADRNIDAEITRTEERLARLRAQAAQVLPTVDVSGPGTKRPAADEAGKDAFDRAVDQIRRRTAVTNEETYSIGKNTFERERNRASAELTEALNRAGIPITEELARKIDALSVAYGKAASDSQRARDAFQGINDAARFFGDQLVNVFDGLLNHTTTWQQSMANLLRALQREMLQAALTGEGAFGRLLGLNSQVPGGTGGIFGSLAGLFGGARAEGGPVDAGKTYLVGEHGPEMIRMGKSGIVIPNTLIGSGGRAGGQMNVIVNNYSKENVSSKRSTVGGADQLEISIGASKAAMAEGQFDGVMATRFGVTPRTG